MQNRLQAVIAGLQIFVAHGGTEMDAQEDAVYAGPAADQPLSDKDMEDLAAAGWFVAEPSEDMTQDQKRTATNWKRFV